MPLLVRVVIDAVAAAPGGGGLTRVRELARSLHRLRAHERLFVVRPELVDLLQAHDPDARIIVRPPALAPLPARIVWEHTILPRQLRSFRPDVVFSPFNVVPLWWPRPRPRLVVMVSNLAPFARECLEVCTPTERRRNSVLRALTNLSVERADRVIVVSRQALDLVGRREGWQRRAELIPQAPPPIASEIGSAPWPRPYVLIAADWYKFKGIETAVEALAKVPVSERPDIVVCGRLMESDYVECVEERVRELGLGDVVHIRGPVDHAEVLSLMQHARACLAPSRFENLSRVTAEAMAAGAPVLARDTPSYREACGDAAFYFSSVEDLTSALRSVSTEPSWRDDLARRGREHVAAMTSDTGVEHIARILDEVAA